MIEELRKKDLNKAVEVYSKGLLMEEPEGAPDHKKIKSDLIKNKCLVYKERKDIDGLVTYAEGEEGIILTFICALTPGQGIGSKLLRQIALEGTKKNIHIIKTVISSEDRRALRFYLKTCGFKIYGKHFDYGFPIYQAEITPKELLNNINKGVLSKETK